MQKDEHDNFSSVRLFSPFIEMFRPLSDLRFSAGHCSTSFESNLKSKNYE
jgi:hypothetical protein